MLDKYLSKGFNAFLEEYKYMYDEYFFIRYWLGGPHIRLRVKMSDDFNQNRFRDLFQDSVTDFLNKNEVQLVDPSTFYSKEMLEGEGIKEIFWKRHGSVEIDKYNPEFSRYGGNENIEAAEKMFESSSDLARIINSKPMHVRLCISIDLYYISFLQLSNEICSVAEQYSSLWRTYNKAASLNQQIEQIVNQRVKYINEHKNYLFEFYNQYFKCLSDCPRSTIFSQIHMTNNRLGVYPELEYWITKCLSVKERYEVHGA